MSGQTIIEVNIYCRNGAGVVGYLDAVLDWNKPWIIASNSDTALADQKAELLALFPEITPLTSESVRVTLPATEHMDAYTQTI